MIVLNNIALFNGHADHFCGEACVVFADGRILYAAPGKAAHPSTMEHKLSMAKATLSCPAWWSPTLTSPTPITVRLSSTNLLSRRW